MNRDAAEARSKLACEPCRKKKTKCPGEQPSCSFCQRLNQRCTYTRKSKSGRVNKPRNDSQAHIQRLETQIDQINNTLQSLTDQSRAYGNVAMSFHQNEPPRSHSSDRARSISGPDSNPGLGLVRAQPASNALSLYPPPEIISRMIETYNKKIHLQPIPLFDSTTLLSQLMHWPDYLLNSFLALSFLFSDDPVHIDREHRDAETYNRLARKGVIPLATEGMSSLEVMKSLCLLALYDITVDRTSRASVNIGIARSLSRVFIRDSTLSSPEVAQAKEEESRCFSTIFLLERIFNKGPYIMQLDVQPLLQSSNMPCPKTPPPTNRFNSLQSSSVPTTDRSLSNGNILNDCLQLISLWDKVIDYMEQRKSSQSTNAWETSSAYSQIEEKIYKFETGLAPVHRFKNLDFCNRSPAEILEYREYWSSWLLLQTTYHSVHALLNHPLFHIFHHDRSSQHSPEVRPPSFIQRSIDQALLHAGWTSRLIRTAREMKIEISDPLIAQEVVVCATIHWIFSFANDSNISQRAVSDLDECQRFLNNISFSWPQLCNKILALEQLLNIAKNADDLLDRRSIPLATLPLLWSLIDPSVSDIDFTVFSRLNTLGEQIPTDHLLRLHESPSRGNSQNSQLRTSPEMTQYPASIMDDSLMFSEGLSGFLDLRSFGDFGPLGDL